MWISPCCFADIKFYIFNSTHCFADQKFRQKEVNLHQIDVGMSNILTVIAADLNWPRTVLMINIPPPFLLWRIEFLEVNVDRFILFSFSYSYYISCMHVINN
jgi:hypothetical protein